MVWSVVNCEATPQSLSFSFSKGFYQRLQTMSIEIVHYQMNCFCVGVGLDYFSNEQSKVSSRSSASHSCEMPSAFRLYGTEDVRGAVSSILTVSATKLPRGVRQDWENFPQKLLALFVHAYNRFERIIWTFIGLQYVLHSSTKRVVDLRNAPHFFPATASSRLRAMFRESTRDSL